MLTAADLAAGKSARRQHPSLRQQYQEYVLQRIESYKNNLSRGELLELGDEAASELQTGAADQFVLTEVLMLETVDRLITRRLRLPSYERWRKQIQALRLAQREPIHWGIESSSAMVSLLGRLEVDDQILVIGAGVQAEACLLAAYGNPVTFVDESMAAVEKLEARIAGESLTGRFLAFVASLGDWLPPFAEPVPLVVIDAGTLASLPYARRQALIVRAKDLTCPQGVHVLLPGESGGAAPEAYLSHYPDWERESTGPRRGRATRSRGVVLARPADMVQEERRAARG